MSETSAGALPAASSFRHRERLASLAVLGMLTTLAFGAVTFDAVVQSPSDNAPTSLAAAERSGPGASRSQSDGRGEAAAPLTNSGFARVNGERMFPISSSGVLVSWNAGAPVEVQDMAVQAVFPGGFWLGTSDTQRVFVTVPSAVTEKGSLAVSQLAPGTLVNVSGRVRELPDNVGSLGLDVPSRTQLATQERLIDANSVRPAN